MKRLLMSVALLGLLLAGGCEPVRRKIIVQEDGSCDVKVSFSIEAGNLERARKLGLPVTRELAEQFLRERGYRMSTFTTGGEGSKKIAFECTTTPGAATAAASRLVFKKTGSSGDYDFEFDPAIVSLSGSEPKPYALVGPEKDQVGYVDCITTVAVPGKVLSHVGGTVKVTSSESILTWRDRLGKLMDPGVPACKAKVRILMGGDPGSVAWIVLLIPTCTLMLGLVMTAVSTKRGAAGRETRGKATRKRGHGLR